MCRNLLSWLNLYKLEKEKFHNSIRLSQIKHWYSMFMMKMQILFSLKHGRSLLLIFAVLVLCINTMECGDSKSEFQKRCSDDNLIITFRKSCRFRRNHHTVLGKSSHIELFNYNAEILDAKSSEIEEAEDVLGNLWTGLKLVQKWGQVRLREKREIWRVINHFGSDEEDLESSSYSISEKDRVELWRGLMQEAKKLGGKVRRETYAFVYKCCMNGCSDSDFKMFC